MVNQGGDKHSCLSVADCQKIYACVIHVIERYSNIVNLYFKFVKIWTFSTLPVKEMLEGSKSRLKI